MEKLICIVLMLAVAACAGYRPVVDMKNVDQSRYETDLKECQAYAEEVSPVAEAAIGTIIGVGIGAAVGGIIGAIFGDVGQGAGIGATLGGAEGAIGGAGEGMKGQVDIIKNCMSGRGYSVLR